MPVVAQRGPNGKHILIHGKAVLQTEEYRGWEIRVHRGGIEGRKIIKGPGLLDLCPGRKAFVDRILEIDPRKRPPQREAEVQTTCEPFIYGNPMWNQAMVRRIRKAIDAWEEGAQKKFGVK